MPEPQTAWCQDNTRPKANNQAGSNMRRRVPNLAQFAPQIRRDAAQQRLLAHGHQSKQQYDENLGNAVLDPECRIGLAVAADLPAYPVLRAADSVPERSMPRSSQRAGIWAVQAEQVRPRREQFADAGIGAGHRQGPRHEKLDLFRLVRGAQA